MNNSSGTGHSIKDIALDLEEIRMTLPVMESEEAAFAIRGSCAALVSLGLPNTNEAGQVLGSVTLAGEKVQKALNLLIAAFVSIGHYSEEIGIDPGCYERDPGPVIRQYRECISESRKIVHSWQTSGERNGKPAERGWGYNRSDTRDYEETFAALLQGRTISSLIEGHPSPRIVDLMASTTVVNELLRQSSSENKCGYAARLSDIRTEEEVEADNILGIELLEEDLGQLAALRRLKVKVGEGGASLVLARPVAGLYSLPRHWIFFRRAINTIWEMLDANNGVALLQVPGYHLAKKCGFSIREWVASTKMRGIDIRHEGDTVMLIKRPNSPDLFSR